MAFDDLLDSTPGGALPIAELYAAPEQRFIDEVLAVVEIQIGGAVPCTSHRRGSRFAAAARSHCTGSSAWSRRKPTSLEVRQIFYAVLQF